MGFAALIRRIGSLEVEIPPDPLAGEVVLKARQMAGCRGKSSRDLRAVEPIVGECGVIQRIRASHLYVLGHQQAHRLGAIQERSVENQYIGKVGAKNALGRPMLPVYIRCHGIS